MNVHEAVRAPWLEAGFLDELLINGHLELRGNKVKKEERKGRCRQEEPVSKADFWEAAVKCLDPRGHSVAFLVHELQVTEELLARLILPPLARSLDHPDFRSCFTKDEKKFNIHRIHSGHCLIHHLIQPKTVTGIYCYHFHFSRRKLT